MCIPSRRILIPFSDVEYYDEYNRTHNLYLSQMRIRIEMSFGMLTTKWIILQQTLNYSTVENAKIVRVCTKLHNYCIRMKHIKGNGKIRPFPEDSVEPISYGIIALADGGNRNYELGFLPTLPSPDETDAATTNLNPGACSSIGLDGCALDLMQGQIQWCYLLEKRAKLIAVG